jgi:hypothetical protein
MRQGEILAEIVKLAVGLKPEVFFKVLYSCVSPRLKKSRSERGTS